MEDGNDRHAVQNFTLKDQAKGFDEFCFIRIAFFLPSE